MRPQSDVRTTRHKSIVPGWFDCFNVRFPSNRTVLSSEANPKGHIMAKARSTTPVKQITRSILILRGHRVLLDAELAALYGVTTKALNQAVKRNAARFPKDFIFRASAEETETLNRSQSVTGFQKHRDPFH
jgi:hypothetical protein